MTVTTETTQTELVLHPQTAAATTAFLSRPSHALLLAGLKGAGKAAIAKHIAAQLVQCDLATYPYLKIIRPDGLSISIESIRELGQFTKLKLPGAQTSLSRMIIIEQAETLTMEAQNALLKLLEEPPAGTLLMLTTDNEQQLLATIRSRVQRMQVRPPTHESLLDHFRAAGYAQPNIEQAYLISGGLPGLMRAILDNDSDHALVQASAQARSLLSASSFERLAMVDGLSKQKQQTMELLFMLQQMSRAALLRVAAGGQAAAARRWQRILRAAYDADVALTHNGQAKLVLLNLMLNL